jgi:4-hydroxythreonine-4-phosphate dehydrogenase
LSVRLVRPLLPPLWPFAGRALRCCWATPNGIGPEIAVKLLARRETMAAADVVVYTDPVMLAEGERIAGTRIDMLRPAAGSLHFEAGRPTLAALDLIAATRITPGEATEAGGRAALTALATAADAAKRGEIDGIVFAPLNKHAMRLGRPRAGRRASLPAGEIRRDRLRQRVQRHGRPVDVARDLAHPAARGGRRDHG